LYRRSPSLHTIYVQNIPRPSQASIFVYISVICLDFSLLEELQLHRFSSPFAFRVPAKSLNELNRPVCLLQIKNPRVTWVLELVNDLFVLLLEPPACLNLPRLDFVPILQDVVRHFLAPFTNSMSSSSASFLSSSGSRSKSALHTAV